MNKQLDGTTITNELKGASSFFEQPQQKTKDLPAESRERKKPNGRTVQPNGHSERANHAVSDKDTSHHRGDGLDFMDELHTSEREGQYTRGTRRFSFEIYSDQVELIDEIKYLYRRVSGANLSASKILRDLIDERLPEVIGQLKSSEQSREKGDPK